MALAVSVYQEQVIHHMAELGLRQASPEVRSVEQVEEGAVRSISTLVTAHRVEEMGRHQESAHQAQKILAVAVEVVVQTHTLAAQVGRVLSSSDTPTLLMT